MDLCLKKIWLSLQPEDIFLLQRGSDRLSPYKRLQFHRQERA